MVNHLVAINQSSYRMARNNALRAYELYRSIINNFIVNNLL